MKEIVVLKSRLDLMGGAEKQTVRLIDAFLAKDCPVTLLTSGAPLKIAPREGLTIQSMTTKSPLSFQKVAAFDRFCDRSHSRKGTIFGLDRNSFQTHLRASNGIHAAYLDHRTDSFLKRATFRLNPLHRTHLALEKKGLTHPELRTLIVNSHLVKQEAIDYYGVDPQKIVVIHNGVEWEEKESPFLPGTHNAPFHFLFIGHNFQRKGLEPLLRGLALLKKEEWRLSVVGKEKNLIDFVHLAKSLRLEERVRFFPPTSDPTPFYREADAVVVPSFYDPFANVTVEALAMGCFVVSSKTNGGNEVLNPASGCTIEALTSPDSVASALKMALNHPKTEASARAIRDSVQHLDFSSQLKKTVEVVLA